MAAWGPSGSRPSQGPGPRPSASASGGTATSTRKRAAAALAAAGLDLPLHRNVAEAIAGHDLVIDATTPNARLLVTREALPAGAHALCEKPLAADEETTAQLLGLAARAPWGTSP